MNSVIRLCRWVEHQPYYHQLRYKERWKQNDRRRLDTETCTPALSSTFIAALFLLCTNFSFLCCSLIGCLVPSVTRIGRKQVQTAWRARHRKTRKTNSPKRWPTPIVSATSTNFRQTTLWRGTQILVSPVTCLWTLMFQQHQLSCLQQNLPAARSRTHQFRRHLLLYRPCLQQRLSRDVGRFIGWRSNFDNFHLVGLFFFFAPTCCSSFSFGTISTQYFLATSSKHLRCFFGAASDSRVFVGFLGRAVRTGGLMESCTCRRGVKNKTPHPTPANSA